jgi:hypothetical protein
MSIQSERGWIAIETDMVCPDKMIMRGRCTAFRGFHRVALYRRTTAIQSRTKALLNNGKADSKYRGVQELSPGSTLVWDWISLLEFKPVLGIAVLLCFNALLSCKRNKSRLIADKYNTITGTLGCRPMLAVAIRLHSSAQ